MAAAGATKSQELIQQLLQAEKQGEDLIQTAKRNRLAKLRQAKEKAEEDLKAFREEQELKFQKETGSKAAADPSAELKDATKAEIGMVNQDYEANKAKTVQYIVSKVLDVATELNETQKQALKTGTV
eukprot:CAMPEP_0168377590 /NCGR_PEP_ID=MMETSP0228-20121227/10902_1 /TAXON_ID=133427 /ORGANISM="Protoceratium reticulatum, Strain CCCM 535 (=CCMP 1889)" /LENGTH=126 /DNA_ID=CAMNT_0008390587 /DNA_START=93 /DNA_END=473 /DNA_ORIENTATION=-